MIKTKQEKQVTKKKATKKTKMVKTILGYLVFNGSSLYPDTSSSLEDLLLSLEEALDDFTGLEGVVVLKLFSDYTTHRMKLYHTPAKIAVTD